MAQKIETDWILFTTILCLLGGGLLMVWSASAVAPESADRSSYHFLLRQVGWAAAAVPLMMYLKKLDYRRWNKPAWVFPTISFVLVLLIIVYKLDPKGRWFRLGPLSFQPSEFAKPVLVLFLAYFVTRRASAINNRHTLLPAAAVVGLVGGMVLLADLGTAVVLVATAAVVFFVAGLEWRNAAVAGAVLAVFLTGAVIQKPYRIARIFGFFDPQYSTLDSRIVRHFDPPGRLKAWMQQNAPTSDSEHHMRQSMIAVGSGMVLGVGPMLSTQKLFYLPEAYTDFIYAVVAEELGLWGALLTLVGFSILGWRGMRIYFRTPDDFGKYLALGVTAMIVIQAFMNISVVLGMTPPKGIPLPLVSYGGSSLASTLISLGLLQSVGDHSA